MRSSYKILNPEGVYFVTSTIVDWIPIFTSPKYFSILIDNFKFYQLHNNLKIYSYVILENHFHMIVSNNNLSKTMQSLKKYTAKEIIENLVKDGKRDILNKLELAKKDYKTTSIHQVWQEGFMPKEILTPKELNQKMEYVHMNPVKRGLVELPEQWIYSSACDYLADKNGLIDIDFSLF
jgi:REP element-mobilizing transposase RayT